MNFRLQLLHASDMEGGGSDLLNAPNFVAIVDSLEAQEENTLFISSGDLILPGPYLTASGEPQLQAALQQAAELIYGLPAGSLPGIGAALGRVEVLLMDLLGASAVTLGNHEFDLGTGVIAGMIAPVANGDSLADIGWIGAQFPYISANLDFSGDPALAGLATEQILDSADFGATPQELLAGARPPKLAPVVISDVGGEQVGIIGLTTQILRSISAPGGVEILGGDSNDMQALAEIVQPIIDQLEAQGVNKIILASHLQQIQFEEELATLLDGVDIIISGGSNALLAHDEDAGRGLFPGYDDVYKTYPILTEDKSGNDVAIVNTDGGWRYVGQLVIEFDANGNVIADSILPETSGAFASTQEQVEVLWGSYDAAFAAGTKGAIASDLVGAVSDFVASQDGNLLGLSDVYLVGERGAVRTEETNLGNLTADANLWYARLVDAEVSVSFKNGGGIREPIGRAVVEGADGIIEYLPPAGNETIGKPEGGISQLDAGSALRFNNDLSIITITRETLVEQLEHAVAASAPGATPGQFAQISGIQFSFDWNLPAGQRVQSAAIVDESGELLDVLVANGRLIGDPLHTVKVVTLGFLADGGDGYPLGGASYLDRIDLVEALTDPGEFTFAASGTEQDAFAEYMHALFAETAYDQAETPVEEDLRIQNLAHRDDVVLDDGVDSLLRLYRGAFDREADSPGLIYWMKEHNNLELGDIAESFVASSEFNNLYGSLSNEAYVDLLYNNALGRQADAPGKAYWLDQLDKGASVGAVLIGFSESQESVDLFFL